MPAPASMLVATQFEGMLENPINPKVEGPGSVMLWGTLQAPDTSYPANGYTLDLSNYMSSVTSIIVGEGVNARAVYKPLTGLLALYNVDKTATGEKTAASNQSANVFPFMALGVGKVI